MNDKTNIEKRVLTVDLQNKNQAAQMVEACHIDLKKKIFLLGVLRAPQAVKYRLEVSYNLDEHLVVAPGESVLLLRYRELQGDSITVDVGKDANVLDFHLYFDSAKIIDCTVKEDYKLDEFAINYTIKAIREDSNELAHKINGTATIKLQKLTFSAPKIEFIPNQLGERLEYNILTTKPTVVGYLRVKNSSDLLRSPACRIEQMSIVASREINAKRHNIDGLIWYGKDVEQTNPRVVTTQNTLTPDNKDASNFQYIIHRSDLIDLQHIEVNKEDKCSLHNNNDVVIPIIWDMTKVKNPINSEERYYIVINAIVGSELDNSRRSVSYNDLYITLLRNNKIMDLDVTFSENEGEKVENGQTLSTVEPDIIPGMTTTYEFCLRNSAEAVDKGKEGARIFVKELSIPLNLGHIVKTKLGEKSDVITFSDENGNAIDLDNEFELGIGKRKNIRITYDHSCIESLILGGKSVFELKYRLTMKFKYYVDKEDKCNCVADIEDDKFTTFTTTLPIILRKAAKPEWMCIDLGTSAIVASYGTFLNSNGQIADNLIELGKQKQKLMDKIHNSDKNKVRDTSETDIRFINSTIAVNHAQLSGTASIASSISDDYKRLSLWLSPTTGMVDFYARMLPSLKSIVGHKKFPKELLPYGVQISDNDPITVEAIFRNTYEQLFKFFIPKEYSEQADNVVMTVPNTYSPANIAMIRNIVTSAIPQLRNIRFISESDAVVFYYLSRRERILQNTSIRNKNNIDKNILVYDMGAGTLDITYVTRTVENGNSHISFKGKLGVSRAGNYLDYLIAEIIVELMKRDETSVDLDKIISLNGNTLTQSHRKSAGVLKAFVRNIVKPMLNSADNTSILPKGYEQAVKDLLEDPAFKDSSIISGITIGQIKNHSKMQTYLREISKDVFEHFNALFSNGDGVVAPTLLIFSGRSTSLQMIREAVKNSLSVFGCAESCKFLDLTHGRICDDINEIGATQAIGSLKTVIVDGAMAFCKLFGDGRGSMKIHNRNVYAQYGAMFYMNGGYWEWVPMIDSTTRALNQDSAKLSTDGTTIYEYDTRQYRASNMGNIGNIGNIPLERNFNDVSQVYILQSYSTNTLKDWADGRRDLITIIGAADIFGDIGNRSYHMTIDKTNKISFFIGNAQKEMNPREDTISESFKKSMWPVVEC